MDETVQGVYGEESPRDSTLRTTVQREGPSRRQRSGWGAEEGVMSRRSGRERVSQRGKW